MEETDRQKETNTQTAETVSQIALFPAAQQISGKARLPCDHLKKASSKRGRDK